MQLHDPAGDRQQPQHDQHDTALIARLVADDLTSADRLRAQLLADACADCRALHRDLSAIVEATRGLPAPRAPRDFRITADQAARLRRTGWLGALLAPFATARSAARPLATAFTTLGLAGLFVAAVLPGMAGGMAASVAPEGAGAPAIGAGATEAPVPQLGPAGSPAGQDGFGTKDNAAASDAPGYVQDGGGENLDTDADERTAITTSPQDLLLIGSLAFLAAGLVLFGLRFAGRRLT